MAQKIILCEVKANADILEHPILASAIEDGYEVKSVSGYSTREGRHMSLVLLEEPAGADSGSDDGGQAAFEPRSYAFTSYSADGQTEYGTGVAETTGETKEFSDVEYTEVEVTENSVAEWIGRKFYIISTAEANGETKYDLYDAEGDTVGVKVTITEQAESEETEE